MDKINFFRKKFYDIEYPAPLAQPDQSWQQDVEQLYRAEVEKSGRNYIRDEYVVSIITQLASWIVGDYTSCLICGGVGLGKTAILKALIRIFDNYRDPINIPPLRCRALVYADASELCHRYVANDDVRYEMHNFKLLVIDDVGCEEDYYQWFGNKIVPVKEIILARYALRLPTILATNLMPQQFAERYGNRVADRVNELYEIIVCSDHESFRRIK